MEQLLFIIFIIIAVAGISLLLYIIFKWRRHEPTFRAPSPEVRREDTLSALTRYSDVTMPGSVHVGDLFSLKVRVTVKKLLPEALEMLLKVPEGEREIRVTVYVATKGLEIQGDHLAELVAPLDRDSDPIFFRMVARQSGSCSATVEFVQDGQYLGGVTVETFAYEASDEFRPAQPTRRRASLDFAGWQEKPDAMLFIHEVRRSGNEVRYRFAVDSQKLGLDMKDCGEATFHDNPSRWINRIMEEMTRIARDDNISKSEIKKILAGFGVAFYEELFPPALKDLYWERLRGNVKSLVIISEEPWIPWEIIKPTGRNDAEPTEDPHLCESFSIARWLSGNGTPRTELHVANAAVIAPEDSGLANRHLEIDMLKGLDCYGIDVVEIPAARKQVLEFCESPGRHLVHFVGHNLFDFDNPDLSSILLRGNRPLFPNVINGNRAKFLREASPLLFFNACHSIRADFNPVGLGGWAKAFLREGASAFIGPFWEVVDDSALAFAQKFYSELFSGKPIGEALRLARLAIKDSGDPTWLAYSLYAHPEARRRYSVEVGDV